MIVFLFDAASLLAASVHKLTAMQSKKDLSERDIITKIVLLKIVAAGWNIQTQLLEEYYFTDGRVHIKGNLYKRKFV